MPFTEYQVEKEYQTTNVTLRSFSIYFRTWLKACTTAAQCIMHAGLDATAGVAYALAFIDFYLCLHGHTTSRLKNISGGIVELDYTVERFDAWRLGIVWLSVK